MKIEVANGEIVDKVSILRIKLARIAEPSKVANVERELAELTPVFNAFFSERDPLYVELHEVNRVCWDLLDRLRSLEAGGGVDREYAAVAREVFRLNDERARIKRLINDRTRSGIVEEKSFDL